MHRRVQPLAVRAAPAPVRRGVSCAPRPRLPRCPKGVARCPYRGRSSRPTRARVPWQSSAHALRHEAAATFRARRETASRPLCRCFQRGGGMWRWLYRVPRPRAGVQAGQWRVRGADRLWRVWPRVAALDSHIPETWPAWCARCPPPCRRWYRQSRIYRA